MVLQEEMNKILVFYWNDAVLVKIVEFWKWRNCIFQSASLREYTLEVCYLAALQLIGNIPNIFLSPLPCSANWERLLGRVFTSKVGDLALGVEYIPFHP